MKPTIIYFFVILFPSSLLAQEIIQIPYVEAPENFKWNKPERTEFWEEYNVTVLANVSVPRLLFYKPNTDKANGSAVIICPGGGLHGLNVEGEGYAIAEWLAKNGIAAFVLIYRLIPTREDALKEFREKEAKGTRQKEAGSFIPLAIADGVSAIDYLRDNSSSLAIEKGRIGIIGFSSGGAVAMGSVFQASATAKPNFVAPIYSSLEPFKDLGIPDDAPPLFVCAASDDSFERVQASMDIYHRWLTGGYSAEIHLYTKGGHGFGYQKNQTPLNTWFDTFGDWLTAIGWL